MGALSWERRRLVGVFAPPRVLSNALVNWRTDSPARRWRSQESKTAAVSGRRSVVSNSDYALASVAAGLFFSAALATFTSSVKPAASVAAMSAKTLRSSAHLAAFRPSMNRL